MILSTIREWLFMRKHRRVCAQTAASELAQHGARIRKDQWIALRNAKTEELRREIAGMKA